MINQRLINRIRNTMGHFYTDACDVKGLRGSPRTVGTVYTLMPCRIVPGGMTRGPGNSEALTQSTPFILEYPYNYTLMLNDQILHSGGDTYQVVDLIQDMTPMTHHKAGLNRINVT